MGVHAGQGSRSSAVHIKASDEPCEGPPGKQRLRGRRRQLACKSEPASGSCSCIGQQQARVTSAAQQQCLMCVQRSWPPHSSLMYSTCAGWRMCNLADRAAVYPSSLELIQVTKFAPVMAFLLAGLRTTQVRARWVSPMRPHALVRSLYLGRKAPPYTLFSGVSSSTSTCNAHMHGC